MVSDARLLFSIMLFIAIIVMFAGASAQTDLIDEQSEYDFTPPICWETPESDTGIPFFDSIYDFVNGIKDSAGCMASQVGYFFSMAGFKLAQPELEWLNILFYIMGAIIIFILIVAIRG